MTLLGNAKSVIQSHINRLFSSIMMSILGFQKVSFVSTIIWCHIIPKALYRVAHLVADNHLLTFNWELRFSIYVV